MNPLSGPSAGPPAPSTAVAQSTRAPAETPALSALATPTPVASLVAPEANARSVLEPALLARQDRAPRNAGALLIYELTAAAGTDTPKPASRRLDLHV